MKKEQMLQARESRIDYLIENKKGQVETYKDLIIVTYETIRNENPVLSLEAWRGNAMHSFANYIYRNESHRSDNITRMKTSADQRQEWKSKQVTTLSQAALAAKAIRQELKKAFPNIKFQVLCQNYSMGDNVTIRYEDGVRYDEVKAITDKYQGGRFDAMNDIYEYNNTSKEIPQSKYVHVHRCMSEATKQAITLQIHPADVNDTNIWRKFQELSF